jgi:SulP family sulfate permease
MLLGTALVIALVGGLESLLSQQALDEQMQTRHEPGRELAALGVANVVTGLLGGLPVVQTRVRALATWRAGGSRALATVAGSLTVALVYAAGAPLLALLPLPLLAATMVVAGIGLADGWSGRLLRHGWRGDSSADLRAGLWVMLAVCGVTLWLGFAAGVLLGVLLSMAIFVARMNRSLLRAQGTAAEMPSRRIYPPDVEARLLPLRASVAVWELEGALFFGNADRLPALAESLPRSTRSLVIDLARVGSVDESGAAAIGRLAGLMAHRPVAVRLAGLPDGSALARTLRAHGVELPHWPDADRAIEAAEQALLGPAAESTLKARPLLESDLLQGLAEADAAIVQATMQERRLFEGEPLFRQGDEADGLYVLTVGSVSVVGHGDGRTQRYLSLSPGMMVGETAMLDGGRRSADAVADGFAVLHHLGAASLAELEAAHPAIAARLHRNIAVHLSRRLRAASAAWWAVGR